MSSAYFKLYSKIEYFCICRFTKEKPKCNQKFGAWNWFQNNVEHFELTVSSEKWTQITHTCSIVWMECQRQNQSSIEAMNIFFCVRSFRLIWIEISIWVWLALCFMLYAICKYMRTSVCVEITIWMQVKKPGIWHST